MKVKDDFFSRGSFKVENGKDTMFWENSWLGRNILSFAGKYHLVQEHEARPPGAALRLPFLLGWSSFSPAPDLLYPLVCCRKFSTVPSNPR
jgi:hypothetical protein